MKLNVSREILLFLVGLIIFGAVFYFIGIEKLLYQLLNLNPFYYLISVFAVFLTVVSWMFKWKTFIKSCGYNVSNIKLLRNLTIGIAVNNLTPIAKLGGEPLRAYILKTDDGIPVRRGLATIISDLTIEFFVSLSVVILSVSLITFYIQPPLWLSSVLILFIAISVLAFGGIFGIYSNRKFISKILLWVTGKVKKLKTFEKTILKRYRDFQITFKKNFQNKKIFLEALFYGVSMKVFDVIKFLFIFLAIGYPIGLPEILISLGIAIMLMSIPSTPGSLGIWEGGMISAFTLIGIPLEISATAVFLERLLWFWGITLIGSLLGIRFGVRSITEDRKLTDSYNTANK